MDTERTARAFLSVWNGHTDKLIADVDPSQQDSDAFHASTSAGGTDEARKTRRLQLFTMMQASVAAMINIALASIAPSVPSVAVAKLVTTE